ncbi:hypothetical protein LSAT2_001107 [Lamellibrachia satsuma]|nr:hypothetical protein LSAT2_001107 [Lamellibrachia satsuma]
MLSQRHQTLRGVSTITTPPVFVVLFAVIFRVTWGLSVIPSNNDSTHRMEIGEFMNLTTSYKYAPCPSVICIITLTETMVATPKTTNFEPKRDHEVDIIVDNK